MQHYKIIHDEEKLAQFIDYMLMPTHHTETPGADSGSTGLCYYLNLMGRAKWLDPAIKDNDKVFCNSQVQLKRIVCGRDHVIRSIRQLECPVGAYTDHQGHIVPQEALGLYIMLNPRSHKKAMLELLKQIAITLENEGATGRHGNVKSMALTAINKSKGEGIWFDIDVDFKAPDDPSKVRAILSEAFSGLAPYEIIETKNGCHVLIRINQAGERNRSWHQDIRRLSQSAFMFNGTWDFQGDSLTPVPGCCQGGFMPELWTQNGGWKKM